MQILKSLATIIVAIYGVVVILLYLLQTRLIFYPGKLSKDFRFNLEANAEEVFAPTSDAETIHGLFYQGTRDEVILYFHGNAGDLSGWQFVSDDFTPYGYDFFIIDYRGYGKSTGTISEEGFCRDAEAAWKFLVDEKQYRPDQIIIYGRSIGTGVAVDLAARHRCKGLVLEAPYTSLKSLADEKFPMLFAGTLTRYRFDNLSKINNVKCPIVMLHGNRDTLIPPSHTQRLFDQFEGKKKMIIFEGGAHNDLNSYKEHEYFLREILPTFFEPAD